VFAILVTLSEATPILTDSAGRFRFTNVRPGRHTLSLSGIGHAPLTTTIGLTSDTTVALTIDVVPIPLDTLAVEARQVRVRGVARDKAADIWLMDAEVVATPDFQARTDPIGRFDLDRAPSGVPLVITVRSFGFLPQTVTLVPSRDTTLVFEMEEDPVVQAMIAEQMTRLDSRLADERYEPLPTLERKDLLKSLNRSGTLFDVLYYELGSAMWRRVACAIIDENQIIADWKFGTMYPDLVHRVEILELPGSSRRLALRIYTRAFVEAMVNGQVEELVDREQALRPVLGRCR
jgi:hypothetical protein